MTEEITREALRLRYPAADDLMIERAYRQANETDDDKAQRQAEAAKQRQVDKARFYGTENKQRNKIKTLWNLEEDDDFLVPYILPRNQFTLLAGDAYAGKTTALWSILADCYDSGEWLGELALPFSTVYLTEDPVKHLAKLVKLTHFPQIQEFEYYRREETDLTSIMKILDGRKSTADLLLIIDTLGNWTDIEDTNSYSNVGDVMRRIASFAHSNNVTVLATHHINKAGGNAMNATLGSVAFKGAADNNLVLTSDDDNYSERQIHYKGRGTGIGNLRINMENGRYSLMSGGGAVNKYAQYFAGVTKDNPISTNEVVERSGNKNKTRLRVELEKLGFAKVERSENGRRAYYWYMPESAGDDLLDAII